METEPILVGVLFLILGGVAVLRTDLVLRFQIWVQRVIMGAEYIPSSRTYLIMRILGAIFIVIGLLAITGIFDLG